jgi:hypothetical protein
MRQFTEAMAMGGDEFVDAVHAAGRGKGEPPKLRTHGDVSKQSQDAPPKGWLRFLRGSKKEAAHG